MDNETAGPDAPLEAGAPDESAAPPTSSLTDDGDDAAGADGQTRRRRRGSRGGQRRRKPDGGPAGREPATSDVEPEMPEPLRENRPTPEAAERALVRKPQI